MKEKISNAGQTMVQDRGLNAVSFQDLADAVGHSKVSVFHHFKSKDALGNGSGMLSEELQVELQLTADATIDRYKKVFEQGR